MSKLVEHYDRVMTLDHKIVVIIKIGQIYEQSIATLRTNKDTQRVS